jgi:hypothetical protein
MVNVLGDRLEKLDKEIDGQITKLRELGGSELDAAMLDKMLRPYAKLIEVNRAADTDPDEFTTSSAWILGVIMCEFLLNTQDKNNAESVNAAANDLMHRSAQYLSASLNASIVGFHATPKLN